MLWIANRVTDGLDGLAGGAAMLAFTAFGIIAFLGFRNRDIYPDIINPYDLAVFAVAFAGACGGGTPVPTSPTAQQSFLTGTWTGTLSIEREGT